MMETLILFLHADDLLHPSWAIVAQGKVRQHAYRDDIAALHEIAADKTILVIVPAQDVLLTKVTMPKLNRSRLLQAIPFALEEQLIADLETLHFAPGDYDPQSEVPVAIVAHAKMQLWREAIANMQLKAEAFIPAQFALPFDALHWQAACVENVIVRTALYDGFAAEKNNMNALLEIAITSAIIKPENIFVNNYSEDNISFAAVLPVEIKKSLPSNCIVDFAEAVCNHPYLNLLQGKYAVKKSKFPQLNKLWKAAAYLGASWIVLLFLYPALSYFILKHRETALNAEITQIYTRNFPNSKNMIAPKLRMQERLQKLNADVGENHFLLLMAYVGKSMPQVGSIKLKRADFQNGQLTLELTADTADNFSTFIDNLTRYGVTAKQQNATLSGTHINASVVIE